MDAREWSLSKDTPSSSHLVCWHGCLKVASRKRLAAASMNSDAKLYLTILQYIHICEFALLLYVPLSLYIFISI